VQLYKFADGSVQCRACAADTLRDEFNWSGEDYVLVALGLREGALAEEPGATVCDYCLAGADDDAADA